MRKAQSGGILLSRAAHEQVRGKIDAVFIDLGDKQLKHIAQSVRLQVSARQRDRSHLPGAQTAHTP
jgi:hypothetical protein